MIGVPINLNSVHVSMVQTGCCKREFDSTYPIHLNGIIGQDEFRESINRINQIFSSNAAMIILAVIFSLSIIGGMLCSVIGPLTVDTDHVYGFLPLTGVGIGLTVFGTLFFVFGAIFIQLKRTTRMREVIAEESVKYSARSPTPCSWRLETSRNFFGGYGNNYNNRIAYNLVIDIGRSSGLGSDAYYSNQGASESAFHIGQQNSFAPPAYAGQSTSFCAQCGTSRPNLSARFCSSCGHSFEKN